MAVPRRRSWLGALLVAVLLAGCASAPPPAPSAEARAALAPGGVLRVGVYAGSPTSLVQGRDGRPAGLAHDLGQELARWLGVRMELVEYRRIAQVIEGMKTGEVDFTFTNATEARARDVDFTLPLLGLELGYLVPAGSRIASADAIDRPGVRVGVVQGSSSQGLLGTAYRQAQLVPVPSLQVALQQLRQGQLDVFATNKGILFELADQLPGARVLSGRWGTEQLAIAIPKGRQAGMAYLSRFALTVRRDGTLQAAIERAGLRGAIEPTHR
jgi:polar amino acid transport system substrate-binding protein